MTAKEKAKELVDKFYNEVKYMERAKQCALIAVDEAENSEYNVLKKFGFVTENYTSDYWQWVKDEIEKL
jgi:hypothetical protein